MFIPCRERSRSIHNAREPPWPRGCVPANELDPALSHLHVFQHRVRWKRRAHVEACEGGGSVRRKVEEGRGGREARFSPSDKRRHLEFWPSPLPPCRSKLFSLESRTSIPVLIRSKWRASCCSCALRRSCPRFRRALRVRSLFPRACRVAGCASVNGCRLR